MGMLGAETKKIAKEILTNSDFDKNIPENHFMKVFKYASSVGLCEWAGWLC